ncbi:DNA gyrase subunit A [Segatella copri]|nr:DNA gyrase subunit A [Segatella copri]
MGQKDLLIDTQGNWGNILTGDRAAAPRYIEARLSKFALDVVFNPKTTDWQLSYDGRNKEPSQDRQARQQDTRYQRDTIQQDYRQPHRFYHQSGRKG